MLKQLFSIFFSTFIFGLSITFPLHAGHDPQHLKDAHHLLEDIAHHNTDYVHGDIHVTWKDDSQSSKCFTDSSGFINALFTHSYDFTKKEFLHWVGTDRPVTKDYYQAIVDGNRFQLVDQVHLIHPGDLIAISYPDGTGEHGHMMLVNKHPEWMQMDDPLVTDTQQWEIQVVDCAPKGHGHKDSRTIRGGTSYPGLGHGIIRVYVNGSGQIEGYTWTTASGERFFPQSDHPLVVGKFLK